VQDEDLRFANAVAEFGVLKARQVLKFEIIPGAPPSILKFPDANGSCGFFLKVEVEGKEIRSPWQNFYREPLEIIELAQYSPKH